MKRGDVTGSILRNLLLCPILLPICIPALVGIFVVWLAHTPFRSRRITPSRCQPPSGGEYSRPGP